MKKLVFIALLGLSSTAIAAPVGQTFTGWGVGADLTSTKYSGAKRVTGFGLAVDYGFDYGNNLVGLVEGKVKLNDSKLVDEKTSTHSSTITEKTRISAAYLQGYRVLPNVLPYVKVSYSISKFKAEDHEYYMGLHSSKTLSTTTSGLGFGLGVKYAVSSNFEVGGEFLRTQARFDGDKLKANTFGANATYRF